MATLTNEELHKQIVAFMSDYSIEATPHDEGRLDEIRSVLKPGQCVYIAHPPGVPIDDIVKLAGKVQHHFMSTGNRAGLPSFRFSAFVSGSKR